MNSSISSLWVACLHDITSLCFGGAISKVKTFFNSIALLFHFLELVFLWFHNEALKHNCNLGGAGAHQVNRGIIKNHRIHSFYFA